MTLPTLTRRKLLGAMSAAAVLPKPVFADSRDEGPLHFLAIGDWGRDGASHQRDVAAAMDAASKEFGARFVMSVGDNFYDNGVQSVSDPQWKTSFEDVYIGHALHIPWYVALGNHDYRGKPQAQIDYSQTSARWRMPSRYYKVDGATLGAPQVDFFCIDTSPLVHSYREKVEGAIKANVATQDVAVQLAWLDRALASSKAQVKIVFGHHTVFSGGSGHGNTPELVELVRPILERRSVRAYINGHDHDLQHIRVGSIDYITSGAGSEVRPTAAVTGTRFCASRSGFAAISVTGNIISLTFRDFNGAELYTAALG